MNSRQREKHKRKAVMLWADGVGHRRSEAILTPKLLAKMGKTDNKGKSAPKKAEEKFAMRRIEFNKSLGGREWAQLPPLPPAPPNPAHTV